MILVSDHSGRAGAVVILLLLCLVSCKGNDHLPQKAAEQPLAKGCRGCHAFTLDANHAFACPACHGGDNEASSQKEAHAGLVAEPAAPVSMERACGRCHETAVRNAAQSLHFTLANEINMVRKAFGAKETLASLTDIPVHEAIASPLQLADDLLRRRCLQCHVYSDGDSYPETGRGTGCAACHLSYRNGALASHHFLKTPTDNECLHCHYGNYVGADYYGRYEHDYSEEFRTPYRTDTGHPRPYGVEYHQLQPDIHQVGGMGCSDCHTGGSLMGLPQRGARAGKAAAARPSCERCHDWPVSQGKDLPENLTLENGRLFLTTRIGGKKLAVPPLRHPAHAEFGKQAACAVCHAQWTFTDSGVHLLRQDVADYDQWSHLAVQGAFEVEDQLTLTACEKPFMRDTITGTPYRGIWFKSFELRRWETPLVGKDTDGRLKIFRPVLDLHLSFVNTDAEVVYDNAGILGSPYQPYTPHTTGRAGAFYRQRLRPNLGGEQEAP